MESAAVAKTEIPADSQNPSSENPTPEAIAVEDRLVLVMFMVVGFTIGAVVVVDLFVGFFR